MDSLSSVSPSFVLPSRSPLCSRRRQIAVSFGDLRYPLPRVRALFGPRSRKLREISCGVGGAGANKGDSDAEDGSEDVDMERALSLDGNIPGTSNEFVKRVSSRAYDMRRHLHQTFDSSSYDGILYISKFITHVRLFFIFFSFLFNQLIDLFEGAICFCMHLVGWFSF